MAQEERSTQKQVCTHTCSHSHCSFLLWSGGLAIRKAVDVIRIASRVHCRSFCKLEWIPVAGIRKDFRYLTTVISSLVPSCPSFFSLAGRKSVFFTVSENSWDGWV